jgi:L-aminopeptidase/D-esterase-like protein
MKLNNAITDVSGIEVGHAQNETALTGCTVILCRKGAVAGVDVRYSTPSTWFKKFTPSFWRAAPHLGSMPPAV